MKVACEELSLECSASTTTDDNDSGSSNVDQPDHKGPKFCLKSLTSQEIPEKDNSIHRHPKDE